MHLPTQLSQFLRKAPETAHGLPPIARPHRDWHAVMYVCTAIFAAMVAVAALLFFMERQDAKYDGAIAAPAPTLNADRLEKILARYEALELEHAAILTAPSAIADPSQPK